MPPSPLSTTHPHSPPPQAHHSVHDAGPHRAVRCVCSARGRELELRRPRADADAVSSFGRSAWGARGGSVYYPLGAPRGPRAEEVARERPPPGDPARATPRACTVYHDLLEGRRRLTPRPCCFIKLIKFPVLLLNPLGSILRLSSQALWWRPTQPRHDRTTTAPGPPVFSLRPSAGCGWPSAGCGSGSPRKPSSTHGIAELLSTQAYAEPVSP